MSEQNLPRYGRPVSLLLPLVRCAYPALSLHLHMPNWCISPESNFYCLKPILSSYQERKYSVTISDVYVDRSVSILVVFLIPALKMFNAKYRNPLMPINWLLLSVAVMHLEKYLPPSFHHRRKKWDNSLWWRTRSTVDLEFRLPLAGIFI